MYARRDGGRSRFGAKTTGGYLAIAPLDEIDQTTGGHSRAQKCVVGIVVIFGRYETNGWVDGAYPVVTVARQKHKRAIHIEGVNEDQLNFRY